ncbi:glycosyltransferase family 2 protein [Pseudomonas sp. S36]|uniref:glycosyltransferase family 2 protein n=1 Tax=Pseudomonas sp. S36 TaxID=2767447 RepID=UPI0019134799|nr:glycosyltransferase family 2 protein [Pseudomonas sp. S36]MBK4991013.1 glycosyltransferase family 2 protein [Pseudomonas sp. S36]
MNIACLMMQKNEGQLLEAWITYHSKLFGAENIFIYDNGSVDEATLSVLNKAELAGVNVDYSYNTRQHFEAKGKLFTQKIHELEGLRKYDFFFPLDGDEFLVAEAGDKNLSTSPSVVRSCLEPFKGSPHVLMIGCEYNNNPLARDYYKRRDVQRKCFFAQDACKELDMGYHNGKAKLSDQEVRTPIVYVHFHNKNYESYQRSAREKLVGRVKDFSEQALKEHLEQRKIGFHVIPALLQSKSEYEKNFSLDGHMLFAELRHAADNSNFFDSFKIRSCKGFVESITKTSIGTEIRGWAVNEEGEKADSLRVYINGSLASKVKVTYHSRMDVLKSGMAKSEGCGFEIILHEECPDLSVLQIVAVVNGEERILANA